MRTLDFGDFQLSVRESFSVHTVVLRGPDASTVSVAGRDATFRPTLVAARSERPLLDRGELEAFAEVSVGLLSKLPEFAQQSRKSVELASGHAGVLQHHRFVNEHGLKVEQLQLYVLLRGPALIVTATDLAGEAFAGRERDYRLTLMSVAEAAE